MSRRRRPTLQGVSNALKVSIFLTKLRKPIVQKLSLPKRSGKVRKVDLLKHYNYGFIEEYQFTPSGTPLIYHYKRMKTERCIHAKNLYPVLFLRRCFGRREVDDRDSAAASLAVPFIEGADGGSGDYADEDDDCDDEDSIDQRAERFIERFYEELRVQNLGLSF